MLGLDVELGALTNKRGQSCEIIVTLRDRPAWKLRSGGDPRPFLAEVKALGIRVDIEDKFFLW